MSFETKSLTNESTGMSIKIKNLPVGTQKCKVNRQRETIFR
jgi:hypothetical protein